MTSASSETNSTESAPVLREGVVPIRPRGLMAENPTLAPLSPSSIPTMTNPAPIAIPPTPTDAAPKQVSLPADRAFIGVLTAIAAILATRLLLLLAIGGTFALAVLREPSVFSLAMVAVFGALTIGPLTWLEIRKGR